MFFLLTLQIVKNKLNNNDIALPYVLMAYIIFKHKKKILKIYSEQVTPVGGGFDNPNYP